LGLESRRAAVDLAEHLSGAGIIAFFSRTRCVAADRTGEPRPATIVGPGAGLAGAVRQTECRSSPHSRPASTLRGSGSAIVAMGRPVRWPPVDLRRRHGHICRDAGDGDWGVLGDAVDQARPP